VVSRLDLDRKGPADPAAEFRAEERKALIREAPPKRGTGEYACPVTLIIAIDYKGVNRRTHDPRSLSHQGGSLRRSVGPETFTKPK
jgi:hypothetical protein